MKSERRLKAYIAAPFFSYDQKEVVKSIEGLLDEYFIDYYSPMRDGVLKEMSKEERAKRMEEIYNKNLHELLNCDLVVAVIDDYDTGTVFEIGYFTRIKTFNPDKKLITYSPKNYGLNVMLQFSVDGHAPDFESLEAALQKVIDDETPDETHKHRSDTY